MIFKIAKQAKGEWDEDKVLGYVAIDNRKIDYILTVAKWEAEIQRLRSEFLNTGCGDDDDRFIEYLCNNGFNDVGMREHTVYV